MTSWFCIICDKTIILKRKSKHINSNSHKHNEKFSILVKVYEFDNPDNNWIISIFDNCGKDCWNKNFNTFKLRCIYGIEITDGDFFNGIISDKKYKQIVREKCFIHKLTIKICSNLSNVTIRCYLKFPILKMHRNNFLKYYLKFLII